MLAPGPAQWVAAFADGQGLKDIEGEGRLTQLDSLSQPIREAESRSSREGVCMCVWELHFITQLGQAAQGPTLASHSRWETPDAASEK